MISAESANKKTWESRRLNKIEKAIRIEAAKGSFTVEVSLSDMDSKTKKRLEERGYEIEPVMKTVNHGCGFVDTYQCGYRILWYCSS